MVVRNDLSQNSHCSLQDPELNACPVHAADGPVICPHSHVCLPYAGLDRNILHDMQHSSFSTTWVQDEHRRRSQTAHSSCVCVQSMRQLTLHVPEQVGLCCQDLALLQPKTAEKKWLQKATTLLSRQPTGSAWAF